MSIKSAGLAAILLGIPCFSAPPCSAQVGASQAQTNTENEAEARFQIGERFWDMGLSLAGSTRFSKAAIRESATLIEAATRMNPVEPRFFRLLATMREQAGDTEGQIDAWVKYRALVPDDRVAQVELIDLYLRRFQTNEEKIKYLNSLLGKASLHNHVKAWVAVKLVPLLDQRSREQAIAMLAQARGFYPLPEVTLLEWQMLPADATPIQRFVALLNILRANPTQAEAIGKVADMLAGAGLSEQALSWYSILMDVHASQGTGPDPSSVMNYLAERYRAGESTVAAEQLDAILLKYPDNPDAWLLRLTIARGDESASMLKQAQQMFLKRLNVVCDRILQQPVTGASKPLGTTSTTMPAIEPALPSLIPPPISAPTTAPATQPDVQPVPPIAETVARMRQLQNQQLQEALIASLADLAWFEVYFDHQTEAAIPALKALKELVPADNIALRRLLGWFDFVSNHAAEARAVFTAQQSVDPLSALGLFQLEDQQGHSAEAAAVAGKILSDPRSGVLGAMLWQATKGRGFKAATRPAVSELQTELDKFPKDWLQVVHTASRFYSIRAEPVKVGHRLGEPFLAIVAIQNECKLDITIGEYGLIKPTLLFDAQLRGPHPRSFRGIVADRIMGRLVLAPGESVMQAVRIDHGELSDALRVRPAVPLSVKADVLTDPLLVGNVYGYSAGGYVKDFSKMLVRTPISLAQDRDRRKLFAAMAEGTSGEKILDIELLAAYVTQYTQPGATVEEKTFAQQYVNVIEESRSDRAPGVKLWASYTLALLTTGPKELQVINEMMQSNSWESRLLGLVAARYLPPDSFRKLAEKEAAGDTDPLVKTYASELLQLLQSPTTQPAAIQPATTEPAR